MGLPKGKTNNKSGRPKGSENKIKKELREQLSGFVEEKLENIDSIYEGLNPRDKVKLLTEILPYCIPKFNSIDVKDTSSEKKQPSLFDQINRHIIENRLLVDDQNDTSKDEF
jgi:hypothetical protein